MSACQIRPMVHTGDSGLKVHEANAHGLPLCGQAVRKWNGWLCHSVPHDGPVTCGKCLRLAGLRTEGHDGRLLSGEVTCSCGWTSGHHALAVDAVRAFNRHRRVAS